MSSIDDIAVSKYSTKKTFDKSSSFINPYVLLKLNIYKILVYDACHICVVKRLVRSQPSPIPSSYSNETMPNAEQFMITLYEHQAIVW
jgi:hypothetical protein